MKQMKQMEHMKQMKQMEQMEQIKQVKRMKQIKKMEQMKQMHEMKQMKQIKQMEQMKQINRKKQNASKQMTNHPDTWAPESYIILAWGPRMVNLGGAPSHSWPDSLRESTKDATERHKLGNYFSCRLQGAPKIM